MNVDERTLGIMRFDLDLREEIIRKLVYEGIAELPKADTREHIIATYFLNAVDGKTLKTAAEDVASHQTTAIHSAPKGSLVDRCTGHVVDTLPFDSEGKTGLVRIAFPVENMVTHADGLITIYSTDIMHIVSGAVQHEFRANGDIKLVDVAMSDEIINMFPGPSYGPEGVRRLAELEENKFLFGTIVKPCTGITPEETANIVGIAAANPFLGFVKEDENFHPNSQFAPLEERVKLCVEAIKRASEERGKGKIIYAPHIGSSSRYLIRNLDVATIAGASAVMFSETYTGGSVRVARDFTGKLDNPPAIYGHNGGIGSRTRNIYREVIDMFARLDGIDFRQTGPTGATAYLRPYGIEWEMSERVLTRPLGKHKPVMVTRAGGLDQGNIIINLQDIEDRKLDPRNYHFLAGSAINGYENESGEYAPMRGARAMEQAVQAFYDPEFDNNKSDHVKRLHEYALRKGFRELTAALRQRYKEK